MAVSFLEYLHVANEEYVYEVLSIDTSHAEQDIVNMHVFPDVPSEPVLDIRDEERIRVIFDVADAKEPRVEVCREDFPSMAHVNPQFDPQSPKTICLFAELWQDRRPFWNNSDFLFRIFMWFSDAAEGKLHRDDQAVEPLFVGSPFKVVLSRKMLGILGDTSNGVADYGFTLVENSDSTFLIPANEGETRQIPVKLLGATARERVHGQLQLHPRNFGDLLNLLDGDIDGFTDSLIENARSVTKEETGIFMLFVKFPIKREIEGKVERVEYRLFKFSKSLYEVAEQLGIIGSAEGYGQASVLVNQPKPSRSSLAELSLIPLEIIEDLSREKAQLYGGVEDGSHKVLMVGSGAIGSQVHMNLTRIGWGEWVVVDNDLLLPHNVVRHASNQSKIGFAKSKIAEVQATWITDESKCKALVCDVLNPRDKESELIEACANADIILDCSASVAVARHITRDLTSEARRVSVFIGAGMDSLVFLGEDEDRSSRLDWLEMQMYRESLSNESVSNAIADKSTSVRYGGSCRNRSVQLAQDVVGVMAGLSSKTLRSYVGSSAAEIRIYNTETDNSISCSRVEPCVPESQVMGDWRVMWDSVLIERMEAFRGEKLPNETGGVLLGSRDTQRNIIYVVDVLPAPNDSKASEKEFVRGIADLESDLEKVRQKTAGGLEYVGEWHSHPDGCSAAPSPTDCVALTMLRQKATLADIPVVMAIIAESGKYSFAMAS